MRFIQLLLGLFLFSQGPMAQADLNDGRLFDPGIERTQPADNAPEGVHRLANLRGDWDLLLETPGADGNTVAVTGRARITFMNRGHGLMERARVANFDGSDNNLATITLWAADAQGSVSASEGNSWTETIGVFTGQFTGEDLVLHDARRPGGSNTLLSLKRTLEWQGDDAFAVTAEQSADQGATWQTGWRRTYSRRAPSDDFFPVRQDSGQPAPDRPAEAGGFDFLVGAFDASHWMPRPQGAITWQSNATATWVLDGRAVLEFDWHDQDPTLPDAATTILRLYNRSMRRWESLFLSNRGNVPLYFGGVREGQRIVLHPFDAQTGANPLFQWIFFDVRDDAYRWKGLRSGDRGETWSPHWAIEFQRKGTAAAPIGQAEPVRTTAADGSPVFGDHYRSGVTASPTVLLFHQAGGDARGEYGDIARRLANEGFEVFAWDARAGGDRFGQANRTVAAHGDAEPSYCDAYADLEAALDHAVREGSGGPILAIGSSYSAALVVRLAAEHGHQLAGVAPFSPASSRMDDCEVVDWLSRVMVPMLAFRPDKEMAIESVAEQAEMLRGAGFEVFVASDAAHGASMLNPARSEGDTEPTWARLLEFLASPGSKETH